MNANNTASLQSSAYCDRHYSTSLLIYNSQGEYCKAQTPTVYAEQVLVFNRSSSTEGFLLWRSQTLHKLYHSDFVLRKVLVKIRVDLQYFYPERQIVT